MRSQKVSRKEFEFYFPDVDNSLLVQNAEDGSVTICAARNNFSNERKAAFIRELAAEGFIPDGFQWFTGATTGCPGLRWVIDASSLKLNLRRRYHATRFAQHIFIVCCLVWLLTLMGHVILSAGHWEWNSPSPDASSATATISHSPDNDR